MPDLWPTHGPLVARWIEAALVHGEGDQFGEPFRLRADEKLFLWRWYEHHPTTKRWRYRRALLETPKGWGKTELAAACALAEFCGPVAPRSPNVPVAAASWDQADLLFTRAKQMATHERSPLRPLLEPFDTELLIRDRPGRMYRVAAEAGTNDGTLPTLLVADEVHEWTGRRERVHLVISNSLTKRSQGRELNVTTPGFDLDSLAGRLHQHGARVASGELVDDAFLFVWHTAPAELDLADEDQRREAILAANPQAADRPELVDNLMRRFDEIPEHEYRRYHLAQWVEGGGNKYMPMDRWRQQARPGAPVEGTEIVMAFDGSYRHDATGIVGETLDGHLFVVGVWESEGKPEGWTVPRDEVDAAVARAMQRYKVRRFACDPPGWHREILDWMQRYGENVVVEFPTSTRSRMVAATGQFYEAVMAGEVTHEDDPVLTRHMGNAVLKETPDGAHITKDGPNSPRKIDLAVCALVAHDQVVRVRAEPPKRKYSFASF